MYYPLSPQDLALISQLPPEIAKLSNQYPVEIYNTAEWWQSPSFPKGYIPKVIEVYHGPIDCVMLVINGVVESYTPITAQRKSASITIIIDGNFAYIEVEGKEILNKLGGVILPDVTVSPSINIMVTQG